MLNEVRLSCKLLRSVVQFVQKNGISIKPDFTKNNYKVVRGNYKPLEESHMTFFKDLLGENRVVMDLVDLEKYNVDHLKHLRGKSRIALKPKSSQEVSEILSFCNANRLALCPQGGNTGLVGGSVPVFDEIVLSTELLNNIIHLDDTSGVLVCEAGCILENLDEYLADYGLTVPLDLGARGSCHIGGNVSTNAGGKRLLRYGSLHANVLGLEVVTANGQISDCLSTLKKDNTGFHLKHLFIGSEGCLGIITKVAIQCPTKPKSVHLAFLGLQKFEKVLKTFKKAKHELGEILSAVEVIDAPSLKLVDKFYNLRSPIGEYPYYLIIETSGSSEEHDSQKMEMFLETALLQHFVLNGTVTSEPSKQKEIWDLRDKIPDTFPNQGHMLIYDVTLPLEKYFEVVDATRTHVGSRCDKVFGFGHLGDGNLHLQVALKEYSPELKEFIETFIFEKVKSYRGSISAEHGIGFLKAGILHNYKDAAAMKLMRDLKAAMDPNGILNPYKVLSLSN